MLYRLIKFVLFLLYIEADLCLGSLCVRQVIVRVPREKDIGLIFDVTISNMASENKKETLDYFIRSDGLCTLNISKTQTLCGFSRIFGGDFGSLEPGKAEKVSLIWPTVSLYNRVGYCPIVVTSANIKNQETQLKQLLYFDTRFETLDPECRSLRKHKNFQPCRSWDQDFFRNCTPLNCEERYFGKRSFYNMKTEQCDQVPACAGLSTFYDMHINECTDKFNFVSDQDLEDIRSGKYENNVLVLPAPCKIPVKPEQKQQKKEIVDQEDSFDLKCQKDLEPPKHRTLKEFQNCFEKDYLEKQMRKRSHHSFFSWFSPSKLTNWFTNSEGVEAMDATNEFVGKHKKFPEVYDNLDNSDDEINDATSEAYNAVVENFERDDVEANDDTDEIHENDENSLEEISFDTVPKNEESPTDDAPRKEDIIPHKNAPADWVVTLLHGLFIIIATISIYFLICFIIFLIVSWLVHRSNHKESRSSVSNTLTPRHSIDRFGVITRSSLLSQR